MHHDARVSVREKGLCRHAGPDVRIQFRNARQQRIELALECVDRDTVLHSDKAGVGEWTAEGCRRVERERLPQLRCRIRVLKARGGDAYDRRHDAVEAERLSDGAWICPEPLPPQAVADHHDVRSARRVFVGGEPAPMLKLRAEQCEHARRGESGANAFRLHAVVVAVQVHGRR